MSASLKFRMLIWKVGAGNRTAVMILPSKTHLVVVMELLDQQFPVLKVVVHTEVPCLIDVA